MKTVRLDCSRRDVLQYRNVHGVFAWSWLSLYGGRFPSESLPPLEMRTMTRDVAGHLLLPDDVPNGKTQPFMFMVRLLHRLDPHAVPCSAHRVRRRIPR